MYENRESDSHNLPTESTAFASSGADPIREDAIAASLYADLPERERSQALTNLRRYFEIAAAIAEERVRSKADLTHPASVPTMEERSNVDLKS